MLRCGQTECCAVIPAVLDKRKAKPKPKPKAKPVDALLDDNVDEDVDMPPRDVVPVVPVTVPVESVEPFAIVLDEQKEYEVKMTKWIAAVMKSLASDNFWARLARAHFARDPIIHLQDSIQVAPPKHASALVVINLRSGLRFATHPLGLRYRTNNVRRSTSLFSSHGWGVVQAGGSWPSSMSKMITDMRITISAEFCMLLAPLAIETTWSALKSAQPTLEAWEIQCCHIAVDVLSLSCDFDRRIGSLSDKFPYRLAWLIWRPHDVPCDCRRALSAYLVSVVYASQVSGDLTTLKVIVIFEQELVAAASSGMLDYELWVVVTSMFGHLHTDSQEIEGVNSILRRIVTIAPSIQQQLLSSRLQIKKHLGEQTRHAKTESECKEIRSQIAASAVQGHYFASEQSKDKDAEKAPLLRFASVLSLSGLCHPCGCQSKPKLD